MDGQKRQGQRHGGLWSGQNTTGYRPADEGQGQGQAEGEGEGQEDEDEIEAPRAAKRLRVDSDLLTSLAGDYIHRLVENDPSLLDAELSNPATPAPTPADADADAAAAANVSAASVSANTSAADAGFGFSFNMDDMSGSLAAAAAAQLHASLERADMSSADRQDTEA
ncbi:hypothetical protein ColTof4_14310 [Colletotrichum tofieldiae]|nr:hypothetical protein ColTof4_14310 [Colletotrichum tofieldiae]